MHLTDAELALTQNAMHAYLSGFGHDEADVLAQVRQVIAKLEAAEHDEDQELPVG